MKKIFFIALFIMFSIMLSAKQTILFEINNDQGFPIGDYKIEGSQNTINSLKTVTSTDNIDELMESKNYSNEKELVKNSDVWKNSNLNSNYLILEKEANNNDIIKIENLKIKKNEELFFDVINSVEPITSSEYNDDQFILNWEEKFERKYPIYYSEQKYMIRIQKGLPPAEYDFQSTGYKIQKISENEDFNDFLEKNNYADIVFDKGNYSLNFNEVTVVILPNQFKIISLKSGTYYYQLYTIKSGYQSNGSRYKIINSIKYDDFYIGETTVANIAHNNVFATELVNAAEFEKIGLYFATKSNKEIEMEESNIVELKEKNLENGEPTVLIDQYSISKSNLTMFDKRFPLDIIFAIDRSGSMGDEIADVKENLLEFTSSLEKKGFDVQYGMVSFCYGSDILVDDNGGAPISYTGTSKMIKWNGRDRFDGSIYYLIDKISGTTFGGYSYNAAKYYYDSGYGRWYNFYYKDLSSSANYSYREKRGEGTYFATAKDFKTYLNSVPVSGGDDGNEMAWDAVAYAINNYPKRENADKMVVLVTDFGTHFQGERRGVYNTTTYETSVYRAVNNDDHKLSISHLVEENVIDLNIICPEKETWPYYSASYEDYKNGLAQYYSVVNAGFGNLYNIATDMSAVLQEIIDNVDKIRRWKITYDSPYSDKDGTEREISFKLKNVKFFNEDKYIDFTTDGTNDLGKAKYTAPKSLGTIINKNFVNKKYTDFIGDGSFSSYLSYVGTYGDYGKVTGDKTNLLYKGVKPSDDIFLIYKREEDKVKWSTSLPGTIVFDKEGEVEADTSSVKSDYDYFITVYPDKNNPVSELFGKVFDGFSTPLIYNNLSLEILKNDKLGEITVKLSGEEKKTLTNGKYCLGLFKIGEKVSIHDFASDIVLSEDKLIELDEKTFILKDEIIVPEEYLEFEIRVYRDFKESLSDKLPIKVLMAIEEEERGISLELYNGHREQSILINSSLITESIDLEKIYNIDDDRDSEIEAVKVLNANSFADVENFKDLTEEHFGKAKIQTGEERWFFQENKIDGKMILINKSNTLSEIADKENGASEIVIKDKDEKTLIESYYSLAYIYKGKYVYNDVASFMWERTEKTDGYEELKEFKNSKIMFRIIKSNTDSKPASFEDLNYKYNVYEKENPKNIADLEKLKKFLSEETNYIDFEFDYYIGGKQNFQSSDIDVEINCYRGIFQIEGMKDGNYQIQAYSINESADGILKTINLEFADNYNSKKASYDDLVGLNYPQIRISPMVNDLLAAPTWITTDKEPDTEDRIINPAVTINKKAYALVSIQGKNLLDDGNEYQFVKNGESIVADKWLPLENPRDIKNPPDMIKDRNGLTVRYFNVEAMPNMASKEMWEDRSRVFKTPSTEIIEKKGYCDPSSFDEIGDSLFFDIVKLDQWKEAFKAWGYIVPEEDGTYYFATISDDGVRGYIIANGEQNWFVDAFNIQAPIFNTTNTPIILKKGVAYPIYLEYMNWGGHGIIELLMRKNTQWPYNNGKAVHYWDDEKKQLDIIAEYKNLYTGEKNYKVPDSWTHPTTNETPGEDPEALWYGTRNVDFPNDPGKYSVSIKSSNANGYTRKAVYGEFEVIDAFPDWEITSPKETITTGQIINKEFKIEGYATKNAVGTIDKLNIWIAPLTKDDGSDGDLEWAKLNSLYSKEKIFDKNNINKQNFEFNISEDEFIILTNSGKNLALYGELTDTYGETEVKERKPLRIDFNPPKPGEIRIKNNTNFDFFKTVGSDIEASDWSSFTYLLGGESIVYPTTGWISELKIPGTSKGHYSKLGDKISIEIDIYDENPKDMIVKAKFTELNKDKTDSIEATDKTEIKNGEELIGYTYKWEVIVNPDVAEDAKELIAKVYFDISDSNGNKVGDKLKSVEVSLVDLEDPKVNELGGFTNTKTANSRLINYLSEDGQEISVSLAGTDNQGIRAFVVKYDYDWTKSDLPRIGVSRAGAASLEFIEIIKNSENTKFTITVDKTNHTKDGFYDIKAVYAIDNAGNISGGFAGINGKDVDNKKYIKNDTKNIDEDFYIDTIAPDFTKEAELIKVRDKNYGTELIGKKIITVGTVKKEIYAIKDGDFVYVIYYTIDYNPTEIDADYTYNKDNVFYPKLFNLGLSSDDTDTVIEDYQEKTTEGEISKVRAGKEIGAKEFEVVTGKLGIVESRSVSLFAGKDAAGNEASIEGDNIESVTMEIDNQNLNLENLKNLEIQPAEFENWGSIDESIHWKSGDVKYPYTKSNEAKINWEGEIKDLYAYNISANSKSQFGLISEKSIKLSLAGLIAFNSKSDIKIEFYDNAGNSIEVGTKSIINDSKVYAASVNKALNTERLTLNRGAGDIDYYQLKVGLSEIDDLSGIKSYSLFIQKIEGNDLKTIANTQFSTEDTGGFVGNTTVEETGEYKTLYPAYWKMTADGIVVDNSKEFSNKSKDKVTQIIVPNLETNDTIRVQLTVYDKMGNSEVTTEDYIVQIPSQTIKIISTEEGKDKKIETEMHADRANVFEVKTREESGITENDIIPESLKNKKKD